MLNDFESNEFEVDEDIDDEIWGLDSSAVEALLILESHEKGREYLEKKRNDHKDAVTREKREQDLAFREFTKQNPTYLNDLNNHIKELFNGYKWLTEGRYIKIAKTPEVNALVRRIGFGMLMRHALEIISIDLCLSNGIEIGGLSVYFRLEKLSEQVVVGMDAQIKRILNTALDYTNGTAHPHIIGNLPTPCEELMVFYNTSYRSVIENHMNATNNYKSKSYLRRLLREMDNFNVKHSVTRILTRGCLVRLLTECTANRWGYNCAILPTDVSTAENPRSVSFLLQELSSWARNNSKNAFGSSALNQSVINNLFQLKSASNDFMHISPNKVSVFNIYQCNKLLNLVRCIILSECSPDSIAMKFDPQKQHRTQLGLTLFCGFGGIFGAHHFFAGNIACGFSRILYLALYIGLGIVNFSVIFWAPLFHLLLKLLLVALPAMDMMSISDGTFETAKWGRFNTTTKGIKTIARIFYILFLMLLFVIY